MEGVRRAVRTSSHRPEPAGKSTPRAPSAKEEAAVAGKQPKKTSIIREGVGRKTYLSKVAFFAGVSGEQK